MTTTLSHDISGVPAARAAGAGSGLSFGGVVRAEWIKLLSLRSIRWSILVMIAMSWGGAALMSWGLSTTDFAVAEAIPELVTQSATFGAMFTVLVMGVIGVLSVTSEYASGQILSTLTAVPSRTPVFFAKALVVTVLGLVVGAVSTFGGGLIAALFFDSDGFAALGKSAVLMSILGVTLYLALAALISYGLGALLRSSAGAISVVVVLFFVSTIAFQVLMLTGWEWIPVVNQWMPADLGNTLATFYIRDPLLHGDVTYWGAMGGLAAWAVAALVPAAIALKTRDAV